MQVDYGPLCPFYFLYNYPHDKLFIWSSILLTHLYTHFRTGDVILWTVRCFNTLSLPKEQVLVNYFLWHPHPGWWGETLGKKDEYVQIFLRFSLPQNKSTHFSFLKKNPSVYYQYKAENITEFQSLTLQGQKVPSELLSRVPCYYMNTTFIITVKLR